MEVVTRPGDDYDEMLARMDNADTPGAGGAPGAGGQVAGTVTLEGRSWDLVGTLTERVTPSPPPPPPPVRRLIALSFNPAIVTAGSPSTGTVRLDAADSRPLVVALEGVTALAFPASVTIPAGQVTASFAVQTPASVPGTTLATVRASLNADTVSAVLTVNPLPAPPPPPPPPPPPSNRINVRDYGALGNGVADEKLAILRALARVPIGGTLYFPAGKYWFSDWIGIERGAITVSGDGPASILEHRDRPGLRFMGPAGGPSALQGIIVEKLGFLGVPGKQSGDGNFGESVQILGPRGAIVRDCEFTAVGTAVNTPGTTGGWGTQIQRLKIKAWGGVCLFLNGGELVEDVEMVQSDLNSTPQNIKSSHGLYIHSGCTDIMVRRCLVQGSWKYGTQLFGKDPNTTIERITFQDVRFVDCANGFTIQQGSASAAVSKQVLLERCEISGCFLGPALSIKNGDGIIVRDTLLKSAARPDTVGFQLGNWTPNEVGTAIKNLQTERLTIEGFTYAGVEAIQNPYGHFENCLVKATFRNNRQNVSANNTPGLVIQSV